MTIKKATVVLDFDQCTEDEYCSQLERAVDGGIEPMEVPGLGSLLKIVGDDGSVSLYIDSPSAESKLKVVASAA